MLSGRFEVESSNGVFSAAFKDPTSFIFLGMLSRLLDQMKSLVNFIFLARTDLRIAPLPTVSKSLISMFCLKQ
jgi:hypothetical protein